jgi:mono/diheme cytochrome c family protein
MNARRSRGGATRITGPALALFLFTALGLPFWSGCGGPASLPSYEPTDRYPSRTDVVVVQLPTVHPTARPGPGKMDESIRTLPALGGKVADPAKLPADKQAQLRAALDAIFGSPAEPTVIGADANAVTLMAISAESLKSAAGGFKARCVQCHGQPGDGRGPNAAFIDPYPRDFRTGTFKRATGAVRNGKPRLDDIVKTLRSGVKGTSMPMFDLISAEDVRATAGYVIHLAVRGEVEAEVTKRLLSDGEDALDDPSAGVKDVFPKVLAAWVAAQTPGDSVLSAEPLDGSPDAIRRGHDLFLKKAGCSACHERYGKKDVYRYDVRGLPNRVRDLTDADYRWGKEPADLAHRIRFGIHPANMPANPQLTEAEVRDLTAFVAALPYPAKLPDDVRTEVEK